MTINYEERLNISLAGNPLTEFETLGGARLATGYERVVIGARGPYVEFVCEQLTGLRRVEAPHYYYDEWRTPCGVKVYEQLKRVDYADYVPGKFYVSPFDLVRVERVRVIEEMRSLKKSEQLEFEQATRGREP
jgi:hypothetical protein